MISNFIIIKCRDCSLFTEEKCKEKEKYKELKIPLTFCAMYFLAENIFLYNILIFINKYSRYAFHVAEYEIGR